METLLSRRMAVGSDALASREISAQDTVHPPPGESVFDEVIQDDGVWGVLGGCQYLSECSSAESEVP